MKLANHFDTFLADVVNINETRLTQLDDSVNALKAFIRGSGWGPRLRGWAGQGSWAHKTIIRPVEGKAFDADILVYVDPVAGWSAKKYLDELHAKFKASNLYGDKVKKFSHCVTIEYAGQRKIDIAPCIKDRRGWTNWEVCNGNTDQFEKSNPLDYTNWIKDRNTWSGNNALRKVTRLLKYLRDIKTTFTCASFLLTTMLGYEIRQGDGNSNEFADVPSALKTIVDRLDDGLQRYETKPTITNPALPSETISELWTDDQYANLRNRIHTYRSWIDDAFDEQDRDESIRKWRRIFGDDFAKSVVIAEAARSVASAFLVGKAAADGISSSADLVALVSRFGARALPSNFDLQPHMQSPPWPVRGGLSYVQVSATLHPHEGGRTLKQVTGLEPLKPNSSIKFDARTAVGMPFSSDYKVKWRITNTDEAARRDNGLRGGFYPSSSGTWRWESLKYRGVHIAEAFVIRRRDNALVAKSPPFYVVIE